MPSPTGIPGKMQQTTIEKIIDGTIDISTIEKIIDGTIDISTIVSEDYSKAH